MSYQVTQSVLDKRRLRAAGLRRCYVCRSELPLESFPLNKSHSTGRGYMCGNCKHIDDKTRPVTKVRKYKRTTTGRYASLKVSAKRRGLQFALGLEAFLELVSKPCVYCFDAGRVGLDRIDNSLGYSADNVLPCCARCNRVRNNYFSVDEMHKHIAPAIRAVMEDRRK